MVVIIKICTYFNMDNSQIQALRDDLNAIVTNLDEFLEAVEEETEDTATKEVDPVDESTLSEDTPKSEEA